MKKRNIKLLLTVLILSLGITVAKDEKEKEIPLSDVPKIVMEAAQKAVPGIELSEAEVEETPDGLVYELEGLLEGKEYEIEVSSDGTVLNIEDEDHAENDEHNDHSDDDEDDEDDDEDNDHHNHDEDHDDDDDEDLEESQETDD